MKKADLPKISKDGSMSQMGMFDLHWVKRADLPKISKDGSMSQMGMFDLGKKNLRFRFIFFLFMKSKGANFA